jgi:hypothetical protein
MVGTLTILPGPLPHGARKVGRLTSTHAMVARVRNVPNEKAEVCDQALSSTPDALHPTETSRSNCCFSEQYGAYPLTTQRSTV